MDRLSVMKAFCRIVERGGITKAAEDLGVSPGLLSRDLKLLEESLGCVLITRTTRRMALTAHGRLYYAESRRLLEEIDAMETRVRAEAEIIRGPLKVNAPHSFAMAVIIPRLPAFLERYPDIALTLSLDDHVVDMIEGGFDLSIRVRADMPDSGLIMRSLGEIRQRLFAAPRYLDTQGAPERPEDLAAHPILAFTLADHADAYALSGTGGERTIAFTPRLRVGGSLALRDLLIAGVGVGALPSFLSDGPERDGALVRVLPDWEMPSRRIYAVTASRRGIDAKMEAFIAFLAESLG